MSKTVPFELRTAAVADAGDIARVYIASWREAYRGIVTEATLEGMSLGRELTSWRRVIETSQNGQQVLVLARPTIGVVGFLTYGADRAQPARGARAEIFTIYVLPRYQGRGGGRRLMAGAAEAIRADGYARVRLWVLSQNVGARAFYEQLGAASAGKKTSQVGGARMQLVAYEWRDLEAMEEAAAGLSKIALPDPLGAVSPGA